ncbi:hypothetical protein D918_08922 [Trichuris suis]|nr:hypothetical protein D918_08922 [Trichuris suis]
MSTGGKKKNIEKRREKSRNDARYRRRSEARIFTELCHILPLTKEPTFYHLDRIAVLRVAVAMCRLRAVTANMFRQGHSPLLPGCARWYNEEDLSELLDGAVFLIVDLRSLIVYVSSSVVETIGMTQGILTIALNVPPRNVSNASTNGDAVPRLVNANLTYLATNHAFIHICISPTLYCI